jgi:hypothetical protein
VHGDWYDRLAADGLLDLLGPYEPVVVGAYPLGIAPAGSRVEVVCRATDLDAFARTVSRVYGEQHGFALHPGALDGEDAVFAELDADGVGVEIAAQRQHAHRRLGAATMGIARVLGERGEGSRMRLGAAVERGEDWLDAAMGQLGLSRAALESLAGARPAIVRRVSGAAEPRMPVRDYAIAITLGVAAMTAISVATIGRGSEAFTGSMFMLEAGVLGAAFGARLGLVASLTPLALIGLVVGGSILVGSESCSPDCGTQVASYTFLAVLVAAAAGVAGALRDRYLPRR